MASAGSVRLKVNGRAHSVPARPSRMLLGVLRDELQLTGAKYGCGAGQCGACTVLVDGKATRSCITDLGSVQGKALTTIEGLERKGALHPLQQAFIAAGAMQCGYCVPGMILSALALLERNPEPDDGDIRRALQGNICRCGVYPRYVTAVKHAAAVARTKAER
jgi:aerobic-type carbon monoxide dehydrogenase small subunit (CoxS/CutS family)